jgi:hypothetical protein
MPSVYQTGPPYRHLPVLETFAIHDFCFDSSETVVPLAVICGK